MHNIGVTPLAFHLPSFRLPADQCPSVTATGFTVEALERYWQDFIIEPELLHRFFVQELASTPPGSNGASTTEMIYVAEHPNSDLAVEAGLQAMVPLRAAGLNVQALIYYSATLDSRVAWSTPCRLQHTLELRGADAFTIAQKGTNSNFAALRVAADMISVEESVENVLLIGAERFVPPYSRAFRDWWICGDSASALLVSRRSFEYRLRCLVIQDADETAALSSSDNRQITAMMARLAQAAFDSAIHDVGLTAGDIRMVLPPNCSLDLVSAIARECDIPLENFYLNGRRSFGFLGTSDLVVNLCGATHDVTLEPGDWIAAFGIATGSAACALLEYRP